MEKVQNRILTMSEHKGWGNTIDWKDDNFRKIYGWITPKLKKDDVIRVEMQSGKVARFVIESIRYTSDPKDMFFANVFPYCYEGDGNEEFVPFEKHDWDHMHDCLLDCIKKNYSREELENMFYNYLPEELKVEAYVWGMSDTCWRDNLWEYAKEHKIELWKQDFKQL